MRSRGISTALLLAKTASAVLVHVSAYTGNVTTLNLTTTVSDYTTQATLQSLDVSNGCGEYPSWLTLIDDVLYCVNENWPQPNTGTLSSFRVGPEGQLTLLSNVTTPGGPVSAAIYGPGSRGLATANYGSGTISTYSIADPSNIKRIFADNPELVNGTAPVDPKRQDKNYPHQAIVDPTGNFLFVPDLGADQIRIFSINKTNLNYTALPSLITRPGDGPRHVAFVKGTSKTFLYVVNELSNTIVGHEVVYGDNQFSFTQVHASNTHGEATKLPSTVAAAEVLISPDSRFLTLSSRFDGTLTVPNYDPSNSTAIPSDPLITFTINRDTGALTHLQTRAAGGSNPRHFSFNKDGTLVGAALQGDGRVVIIQRNPESGLLGDIVSNVKVLGLPNCIIFNE